MHQPKYSRVRRTARLLGLTRNPLCRRVDRLDGGLRIAAALTALVVSALCVTLGAHTYHRDLDRLTAARDRLEQVPVLLLEDARSGRAEPGATAPTPVRGVIGRWRMDDGTVRTATVYPPVVALRGTTVRVWMDTGSTPVRPPADRSDVWFRSAVNVIGTIGVAGVVIRGLLLWGRSRLDRRRDAEWARRWLLYERQWRDRSL